VSNPFPSSLIVSCRWFRGNRIHARERSDHTQAVPLGSAALPGSCTVAFLPCGVPLPVVRALAAWPGDWSSLRSARRRSWGSCPSQFCPASGGATSLPFRTHMPFAPPHPPRLIFVGLIHVRSFGPLTDRLWQSESRVGGVRLLGFAPVCGCACGCHRRRTRSCHGLCLLQGMRTPSWCIGSGTSPDQSSAAALVRPVDAQAAPSAHGLR